MKTLTKKAQRKLDQRAQLNARLIAALRDLYGNGRVRNYPEVEPSGMPSFFEWLGDYAAREIDYMTVERFGLTERETRAPGNGSRLFWIPADWRLRQARETVARSVENGGRTYAGEARSIARHHFAFPSGPYETERAVLIRYGHSLLTESRKGRMGAYLAPMIYSHGRNGKTFYAPWMADSRVGGFYPRESELLAADYAQRVHMVLFLEQFNMHVRSLAAGAVQAYADESRDRIAELRDETRVTMRETREAFHALREETKGTPFGPNIRAQIREALGDYVRMHHKHARTLSTCRANLESLGA